MEEFLFSTKRLVMRRLNPSDLNSFLEYRNDPDIMKYQGWENEFSTENGINFINNHSVKNIGDLGEWMQIGIEHKNTNRLIGDCALRQFSSLQGEFGITIAKQYQRNNYGYEAINRLFDFVFKNLNFHRMTGLADVNNIPSIKLQERLGMRKEGHYKKSFYYKSTGNWEDEYLFAILKEEWENSESIKKIRK